ncbi:16S rRNA (guanine(966)-N(2))-methyltransferase RsmD [Brevibacterium daeguense]|uniref:16S rRNA (Guanine(966)-N(2))-methyltransferase RsmD n=1 Tax=Brevibacterium daeguense TaxID=909936 RepID=A0ABP8ELU5_9MICO
MRIISGTHRGRTLRAPAGDLTRPTSDRVRESLFASLDSLGVIRDARVLDVFAGSGALGLEALSRGASHATFVERAAPVSRLLVQNIYALGEADRTTVLTRSAAAALQGMPARSADLVFADPPYPLGEAELTEVLTAVAALLRDEDSLIVLERSARSPAPTLPGRLEAFRDKTLGETRLWFLQLRAH